MARSRQRPLGPTVKNWEVGPATYRGRRVKPNVVLDCGWGRLIFAHTFADPADVASTLLQENAGYRDIAFYLRDPHVILALRPHKLFLDPSHTFRLWLGEYEHVSTSQAGFIITTIQSEDDAKGLNRIYAARNMVTIKIDFLLKTRRARTLSYFVAKDRMTGEIVGGIMSINHHALFDDPEKGSSTWGLAVDPLTHHSGVGEALIRHVAKRMSARDCHYLDLSVLHDNHEAIALYEKLGFHRIPVFAVKTRNRINEKLFSGPTPDERLNPYATIIINEARRRGIDVTVLDAEAGYFRLTFGGRAITCRESLSELTTAIAMSRCADKALTQRLLQQAGLSVPAQMKADGRTANHDFLRRHTSIVVKPTIGEQGHGVSVDIQTVKELQAAITQASRFGSDIILEQYVKGDDLRIVLINYQVIAAAIRRPPKITGTGQHSIAQLIERQSYRRARSTGGESQIPIDSEVKRCIKECGYALTDRLAKGKSLVVRKTANLHTGGTIHDVTSKIHPDLAEAAVTAARALAIPVVGLDFIVPSISKPNYVIIEANERPGLANHEPQPTAERFIDLLFPQTKYRH